jgi:lipopolysaccharide export system protein LptA
MAWTVERLRRILVALAALLVLVLAGSVLYGRWRLRRATQDLPARLGLQIQQSTQGFVLSKSEGGRPLFTLRASRAIQFKSGSHVSLHQVQIELFNQGGGEPDTIAGDTFEYDPGAQVVHSVGEARIVLHASGTTPSSTVQSVQLITHNLTFNQKTGIATCPGIVTFTTQNASGQAVGATYDARQAHLVLASQVLFRAIMASGPAVVQATNAVYDRRSSEVQLAQPHFVAGVKAQQDHGSANSAVVELRPDHSASQVHAVGSVELFSANGARVQAPDMLLSVSDTNRPQHAAFTGGVRLAQTQGNDHTAGRAATLQVVFNAQGQAIRADLDTGVTVDQSILSGSTPVRRHLESHHLVLHLSGTSTNTLEAADATGDARMQMTDGPAGKRRNNSIAAQQIQMNFAGGQLRTMKAQQNTRLTMHSADGTADTSTGDMLTVDIVPSAGKPGHSPADAGVAGQQIARAVQTGHVVLQQISPSAKSSTGASTGVPTVATATAARADYRGATGTLTLTGSPVFHDAQTMMTATVMTVQRTSGDVTAEGGVQTTLLSAANRQTSAAQPGAAGNLFGGDQPAHIIADRAVLHHATGDAVFTGHARLWQGADSIEAPEINISQKTRLLIAQGPHRCGARCVAATFLSTQAPAAPAAGAKRRDSSPPQVFHVVSAKLVYSDAEQKADFSGGVTVNGTEGILQSQQAALYFAQQTLPNGQTGPVSVRKIKARGSVRLQQPGRHAEGGQLLYTAEDGRFVLTGTPAAPPRVSDAEHGTVSGRKLTFFSQSQEIIVAGAPDHPAETHTTVQKK